MWNAIALVTGGFTLTAFVVAVGYLCYQRALLSKEKLVQAVPEGERAGVVQDFLQAVHVDTTDLTKEQRFRIALEIISARGNAARERGTAMLVIAAMAAVVTTVVLWQDRHDGVDNGPKRAEQPQDPIATGRPEARTLLSLRGSVRDVDTRLPIAKARV
jgi:hypothetical protein